VAASKIKRTLIEKEQQLKRAQESSSIHAHARHRNFVVSLLEVRLFHLYPSTACLTLQILSKQVVGPGLLVVLYWSTPMTQVRQSAVWPLASIATFPAASQPAIIDHGGNVTSAGMDALVPVGVIPWVFVCQVRCPAARIIPSNAAAQGGHTAREQQAAVGSRKRGRGDSMHRAMRGTPPWLSHRGTPRALATPPPLASPVCPAARGSGRARRCWGRPGPRAAPSPNSPPPRPLPAPYDSSPRARGLLLLYTARGLAGSAPPTCGKSRAGISRAIFHHLFDHLGGN
jgi:hypothetical protein